MARVLIGLITSKTSFYECIPFRYHLLIRGNALVLLWMSKFRRWMFSAIRMIDLPSCSMDVSEVGLTITESKVAGLVSPSLYAGHKYFFAVE